MDAIDYLSGEFEEDPLYESRELLTDGGIDEGSIREESTAGIKAALGGLVGSLGMASIYFSGAEEVAGEATGEMMGLFYAGVGVAFLASGAYEYAME